MADLHHVDDDHGLSAFTKEVVSRRGGTMSVEVATQLRGVGLQRATTGK